MFQTSPSTWALRALALAASLALACDAAKIGSGAFAQGVTVSVSPETATVGPQESFELAAAVTGSANTAVTWSIRQGAAGGTVSATGLYTAPSGTGVFEVVATSNSDPSVSGSASITVTSAPPSGGAMTTANRTTGVAPLAVFFDAVDTTPTGTASPFTWSSGVYQPADYEGAQYSWDFGDPSSGAWTQTGNSRNRATGYTAAHVYESPGTYTATLSITDASGTVRTYSQTITVSTFGGTTYYVAANGSDSSSGTSTSAPFATLSAAMSRIGTNVRVLLRRGDTFTVSSQYDITAPGPGIIGAYADGTSGHGASDPRPIINWTYSDNGNGSNLFQAYSPTYGAVTGGNDWRIMDLDVRGTAASYSGGPVGPQVAHMAVNFLVLRLRSTGFNVDIGWGDWWPRSDGQAYQQNDGMFVVESEMPNGGQCGGFVGARRLALLGNLGTDTQNEHVMRVWQAHKAVISNNAFLRSGPQRHSLKLHGPENGDGRPETRWVSISDNRFQAGSAAQWTVSLGSQSSVVPSESDPVSHLIFERNSFTGSSSLQADIQSEASHAVVKNNVFDDTLTGSAYSILWAQRNTGVPAPDDVRIYNNTTYKGSSSTESGFLSTDSTATNLRVRNNLYGTPSTAGVSLFQGTAGAGWAADHNLLTTAPGFTNAAAGSFSLVSASPAANAGVTLTEVREDFNRTARPVGSAYDLGAFESQ